MALNLATAILRAALLIAYDVAWDISAFNVISGSDMPVEMAITFFARPLKIRGMKMLNKWMAPMVLIRKWSIRSCSRAPGSLLL